MVRCKSQAPDVSSVAMPEPSTTVSPSSGQRTPASVRSNAAIVCTDQLPWQRNSLAPVSDPGPGATNSASSSSDMRLGHCGPTGPLDAFGACREVGVEIHHVGLDTRFALPLGHRDRALAALQDVVDERLALGCGRHGP